MFFERNFKDPTNCDRNGVSRRQCQQTVESGERNIWGSMVDRKSNLCRIRLVVGIVTQDYTYEGNEGMASGM